MKSKILLFLVLVLLPSNILAQLEKQFWHFGSTNRGLFFDSNNNYIPVVTSNSYTPYGNEGCATISNQYTGDLMFYSEGISVIDASHSLMPNGGGLNGHSSCFSSGSVCNNPANCDQYYLFSLNYAKEAGGVGNLYYSIVDMSLPGNGTIGSPLGDVTASKNILVGSGSSESIEIIKKTNSHDFWLVYADNTSNSISIYSITSSGISLSSNYVLPFAMDDMRSMNYNELNGKICLLSCVEANPCLLLDFDALTGTIITASVIPGTPWGASTVIWQGTIDSEWSPDGTKLYLSKYRWGSTSGGRLYQYDLDTPGNVPVLIYSVSNNNSYTAKGLRIGPDNKIYFMSKIASGTRYFGVVNNPNLPGTSCNFVWNQIDMGIDLGLSGVFPKFLNVGNTLPAIQDSIITFNCALPNSFSFAPILDYVDVEGDNLSYTVNSIYGGTYIVNGDSIQVTPTLPGDSLAIQIYYQDDYCTSLLDSFTLYLNVNNGAIATNLLNDTLAICQGSTAILNAGAGFLSYSWNDGSFTQTIQVSNPGMYSVTVSNGSCVFSDSTYVVNNIPIQVDIGLDTVICGTNFTIADSNFNGGFIWDDNSTLASYNVQTSGQYWVEATDLNGCTSYDTINVTINPNPLVDLGPDIQICNYDTVYLEALGFNQVIWNDGSVNDTLIPTLSGQYTVSVQNLFGCQDTDTVNVIINVPVNIDLGPDTALCTNIVTLEDPNFIGGVTWNDNSTLSTYDVQVSGQYWVEGTDLNGCISADTVNIVINPLPIIDLGPDMQLCHYETTNLISSGFVSVLWNDGSSNDTLLVSNNGVYSVVVEDLNGCLNSDTVLVNYWDITQIDLGPDLTICADSVSIQDNLFSGTLLWNSGDNSSSVTIDLSGNYSVLGTDWNGCLSYDTIAVTLLGLPAIDLGPDTSICDTEYILTANGQQNIIWGDGSTSDSLYAYQTGEYSVEVISANGCSSLDTIHLLFQDLFDLELGEDIETCGESYLLEVNSPNNAIYNWSNGVNTSSIVVTESGLYILDFIQCGIHQIDSVQVNLVDYDNLFYLPNTFTPDGDDNNNVFRAVYDELELLNLFEIAIYNRWGQLIFYSNDVDFNWDGTYQNELVADGIYVYQIKIEKDCELSSIWTKEGHILVLK